MKVACVVYYAFLGVLRYLNKACVFFICAKYLNKKNKTVLIISISILLLVLTNFTSLVIFNYLPPCLSFWLSFLLSLKV